ncbi:Secretion protein HlyD family protein [Pedobacter cryoconitis]|uniref:Secretion protein HlyD family protein n=1 Tax=Pedobacter cryoconitis TaxID=188932 RepID=A0A127VBD2_9SPHI|nr:HlyD family efflux transporter periplasmic adaptor subunit [Pedobacter cryoconitis]AMP98653.1 Secretion protein HlyD family protein [Pedobacter cryoconitis]
MPQEPIYQENHSEEVNEIITAVPAWILRRGIMVVFFVILSIILLAAFIRYPDVISTSLKINSLNAPKPVYAKRAGKLMELLLPENKKVEIGAPLAFLESTGSHRDVLKLSAQLKALRELVLSAKPLSLSLLSPNSNLGELQAAYQNFYQEYVKYLSTQKGGYYQEKRIYLERDLQSIKGLKSQIMTQQKIQQKEYANIEQQYLSYQKLMAKNVISKSEFQEQENKYLSGKYPLQQTETALLNNSVAYATKEKEILDLENTIAEQRAKFLQAINSVISDTEVWINQYVVLAPVSGTLGYAGVIQQNQSVAVNQELFVINPGNTDFFGEIQIPQNNMGKIRIGQRTLIKMHSYPYEQFGMIRGNINYISDVAFRDSVFIAKVGFKTFESKDNLHKIVLKNGMLGNAEIITEESSLLQRFYRNIIKELNGRE